MSALNSGSKLPGSWATSALAPFLGARLRRLRRGVRLPGRPLSLDLPRGIQPRICPQPVPLNHKKWSLRHE